MSDYNEVMQALRAADVAGNKKDATRLAEIASRLQTPEKQNQSESKPEEPSTFSKVRQFTDVAAKLHPSGMIAAAGGMAMDTINKGLEVVGNYLGEHTQEAATALGASPEVAGAAGAGVNAVTQVAAPGAFGGMLGRAASKVATKAPEITANAAQTAEKLVSEAGIKWGELTRAARKRFSEMAADANAPLANMDKAAMERVARGASNNVRLTKGQALREPAQLRAEEQLAQTEAGKPIRERHMAQDEELQNQLDTLKGKTASRSSGAEETGKNIDAALKKKIAKSDANINRLYDKARRSGELESTLEVDPIISAVKENPAAKKMLIEQLQAMDLVKADQFGNPAATHNITLDQLERVRRRAATVARTAGDGTMRHDAGELASAIDKNIPQSAGGDAYKAARAARKAHAMEFEEPKAISQIVGEKSKTDRVTALESVWEKTVLSKGSSIADVERVRDTLLKGGDRVTRDAGRKAWRDIAGETVDYIKREAVAGAKDQSGKQNLSPAKLNAAIERIGDRKLEIILGKDTVKKLREIAKTVEDVKTMPPYKGGSTTTANAVTLMEKVLEKAQYAPIGNIGRGAVRVLSNVQKEGAAAGKVEEALGKPAATKRSADTLRNLVEKNEIGPTIGATLPLYKRDEENARP